MRGVVLIQNQQGHYQLQLKDIAIPLPGKGQILVRIQCVAVNRCDLIDSYTLLLRKARPGIVLGQEICGTISDIGEGCMKGFGLGDQVIAWVAEGGYSEFVLVDERILMKAPIGRLDMMTLAAIPLAFMNAYHIAFNVAKVEFGELVLIHGAGGAVGLALIQLLSKKGVAVIATVRSSSKEKICRDFGAAMVFNLTETNGKYAKAILERFQQGVNVILDCIGSSYIQENLLSMERGSRMIYFGHLLSGGEIRDVLFLQKLIESEITITTTSLSALTIRDKEELISKLEKDVHLLSEIIRGTYHVPIHRVMELEEFVEAHQMIRNNENIGKVILMVTSTASAVEELEQELNCIRKKDYNQEKLRK
jgi:NADPH:quinone reductase-like Zn-dependent oxidoreductase